VNVSAYTGEAMNAAAAAITAASPPIHIFRICLSIIFS
jgi:hypothetical protein